jgi:hypothetical protein
MGVIPRGEDEREGVNTVFASEQSLFLSFRNGSITLKSFNVTATTRSKCGYTLGQDSSHPCGSIQLKGGKHSLTLCMGIS